MHQLATTTDPRQAVSSAREMLDHVLQHLKQETDVLEDRSTHCLLETTRNVLEGLLKSLKDQ